MPSCHSALMPMWAYDDAMGMDPIYELQADICRTLSHPARIAMLHLMADEPREVGRLAEAIGISQPNASKHLAVMRAAGLVEAAPAKSWPASCAGDWPGWPSSRLPSRGPRTPRSRAHKEPTNDG